MKQRITKTYPLEFKQSSAKLAAESDCPISETARALGVNPNTMHGWVDKYYPKAEKNHQTQDHVNEELKHLRQENVRFKQERDILKKAAAYFASEM